MDLLSDGFVFARWGVLCGGCGVQDLEKLPLVTQWCRMLHDVSTRSLLERRGRRVRGHMVEL